MQILDKTRDIYLEEIKFFLPWLQAIAQDVSIVIDGKETKVPLIVIFNGVQISFTNSCRICYNERYKEFIVYPKDFRRNESKQAFITCHSKDRKELSVDIRKCDKVSNYVLTELIRYLSQFSIEIIKLRTNSEKDG